MISKKLYIIIITVFVVFFVVMFGMFGIDELRKEGLDLTIIMGNRSVWKYNNKKWIHLSSNSSKANLNWQKYHVYSNYEYLGEKISINFTEAYEIEGKFQKAQNEFNKGKNNNPSNKVIKKINHKDRKLNIQKNFFFELYNVGLGMGDIIANYQDIKNEPLLVLIKDLGLSILNPFIPLLFSKILPQALFCKTPIVMGAISLNEIFLTIRDLRIEKSFTKSETYSLIIKKAGLIQQNFDILYCAKKFGFTILMFLNISPGIIIPIVGLVLGIGVGYGVAKLRNYIINKKENFDNLVLFSDSLYYQYIPKKFREYSIPTLEWNGVSNKAESFAIELVEDGKRKWLIINIKKWIRKLSMDNYFDVGENIVEYQGISKHPYKVTFILYELKKERFKPEDWGVGENIRENYSEDLSKYFNQVATLDVF